MLRGCGLHAQCTCRVRGEGSKDGTKCPCGLWVLVAQLWGVLCLLEDFLRTGGAA